MQVLFFVELCIIVAAMVFAVQNNFPVTVKFLVWSFTWPFAGLLIAVLCLGAVASFLASLPARLQKRKAGAAKDQAVKDLKQQLKNSNDSE